VNQQRMAGLQQLPGDRQADIAGADKPDFHALSMFTGDLPCVLRDAPFGCSSG
jgi:hypothetical protein